MPLVGSRLEVGSRNKSVILVPFALKFKDAVESSSQDIHDNLAGALNSFQTGNMNIMGDQWVLWKIL
eukprot:scaffold3351_cov192-Chaetoceros_neogracile.AAC.1